MSIKLRDYQQAAVTNIYSAWSQGYQNVALQLHTGLGKTVVFSKIVQEHEGFSAIVAHRAEILAQISMALARYGVQHRVIAPKFLIRTITQMHINEFKRSFYDPAAPCLLAAVDTLINRDYSFFKRVTLLVQDEAHHVLRNNKWGKIAELFPNAKGLYPTATPLRADGKGLGRNASGVIDYLIQGPDMRDMIDQGYLSDYKIINPATAIDLSNVNITASGDYSQKKLKLALGKSKIVGDIVKNYKKFALGKTGVTFGVSVEHCSEIAKAYRAAGVPAEVLHGGTDPLLRANILTKFKNKEILILVNVGVLGEGFDVPHIEIVTFARPTESYALYAQMFGRALRVFEGKKYGIIIDHVNNVFRHRLPEAQKNWKLGLIDQGAKKSNLNKEIIKIKTCINAECLFVYEAFLKACPLCNTAPQPAARATPEHVEGDLIELDEKTLAILRGEVARIDSPPKIPIHLSGPARFSLIKKHKNRQEKQTELREKIALYAGFYKSQGAEDSEIYKRFYFNYGVDVLTAQTLNAKKSEILINELNNFFADKKIITN